MSHELRTPLNAIAGYTELLELGLRGPVTEAQMRDLARIRASQQHLLGLISAVLDLSRIEAGRVSYDLEVVPLDPFLSGLDSLVAPQAAAKALTLEHIAAAAPLAARADREKLRQVLLNLISNAIRYTPSGGRVTISAAARDARTVAIVVSDTGIGVAGDEQEKIFEPFVQLDRSLTKIRDGIGLGLAISRDLARGMGGEISVESEGTGKGSRFTVTLPRAPLSGHEQLPVNSGEIPAAR
jgi:signal transduction histidine kinase